MENRAQFQQDSLMTLVTGLRGRFAVRKHLKQTVFGAEDV